MSESETLMTSEATTTPEGEAVDNAAMTEAPAESVAAEQQPSVERTEAQAEGEIQKPEGAPEQYEFEMSDLTVDSETLDSFKNVAKELDLPQDKAQALLSKMAPAMQARQQALLDQARESWSDAARSDKEFGGDKLGENLSVAKKAIDAFGTPELKTLLNESGLGNHPEVIRAFYRAGKAISEDGFVRGQGGSDATSDPAKRLFPNQA